MHIVKNEDHSCNKKGRDVNNGIARRSWARNEEAIFAIKRAMEVEPNLKVTLPNIVDEDLLS